MFVRCLCSVCVVFVQGLCGVCVVFVRCLCRVCGICEVFVQCTAIDHAIAFQLLWGSRGQHR